MNELLARMKWETTISFFRAFQNGIAWPVSFESDNHRLYSWLQIERPPGVGVSYDEDEVMSYALHPARNQWFLGRSTIDNKLDQEIQFGMSGPHANSVRNRALVYHFPINKWEFKTEVRSYLSYMNNHSEAQELRFIGQSEVISRGIAANEIQFKPAQHYINKLAYKKPHGLYSTVGGPSLIVGSKECTSELFQMIQDPKILKRLTTKLYGDYFYKVRSVGIDTPTGTMTATGSIAEYVGSVDEVILASRISFRTLKF